MTKPILSNKRANRAAVIELKSQLREREYDVGRSNKGHFSRSVLHAVVQFQNDHKLDPTGIVDEATWAALDGKPKKAPAKKKPAAEKPAAEKASAKKPAAKKAPAKKK
jgi:peptidoglycan hydrolase-like protein with peptidoglycan-binding domain